MPNFDLNEAHWNNFITSSVEIPIADRLAVAYAAVADAIHLCREGAVPVTIADEHPVHTFNPDVISLTSYDETTDLTDSFSSQLVLATAFNTHFRYSNSAKTRLIAFNRVRAYSKSHVLFNR